MDGLILSAKHHLLKSLFTEIELVAGKHETAVEACGPFR